MCQDNSVFICLRIDTVPDKVPATPSQDILLYASSDIRSKTYRQRSFDHIDVSHYRWGPVVCADGTGSDDAFYKQQIPECIKKMQD